MVHTATIVEALFETDIPEVVLARDSAGTPYISLLVDRTNGGDRFLCVPVSHVTLAKFRLGRVDLRDVFTERGSVPAYAGAFSRHNGSMVLALSELAEVPKEWLPEKGFVLIDEPESVESLAGNLVEDAIAADGLAGVLTFSPPESAFDARIDFDHLSEGLRLFQDFVEKGGAKVVSGLTKIDKAFFPGEGRFILQATPAFTKGSFQVHLRSRPGNKMNLLGETAAGAALRKVDEITRHVDDPTVALDVYKKNSGRLIQAYQAMLRFIADQQTPMAFQWAEPCSRQPSPVRRIGVAAAQRTYEVLVAREDLSAEPVVHVGTFENLGAKAKRGTWHLKVAVPGKKKSKVVKGTTPEGGEDFLDLVRFRKQKYRLVCEERTEKAVISGKHYPVFVLVEPPTPVDQDYVEPDLAD